MLLAGIALFVVVQFGPLPTETGPAPSRFAKTAAREVVVPLFTASGDKAAAVVRIQSVSRDLERKGFFRVAALPFVALKGVELEIRDAEAVRETLRQLPAELSHFGRRKPVRVSRFTVRVAAAQPLEVTASSAQLDGTASLLLGNVQLKNGSELQSGNSGVLHLSGEQAGVLVLRTSDSLTQISLLPTQPQP